MAKVQALRKEKPANHYKAVEDAYRSNKKKLGHEYFVIDCDRHIIEPPEAFTMFLDKEFQRMAPKPTTDNAGAPRLMMEGRARNLPAGERPPRRLWRPAPAWRGMSYERAYKHAYDNRDIDMDFSGIDCAVWIPTLGLFVPDIQNWELRMQSAGRSTIGPRRSGRPASAICGA